MHTRLVLLALATVAVLILTSASARAQSGGSSFPTVVMTGKTAGGQFTGRFVIRRFRVRGPGIVVFGRLRGRLRDRRYPSTQTVRNASFSFPVTVAPVAGASTCARLTLVIAARTAPIVGLAASFGAHTLVLRPRRGTGPSTGELLCGTAAAVAANAPPAVTVHLLNALRLQFA